MFSRRIFSVVVSVSEEAAASALLEPFGLFDLSEFPESFDVSESFVSAFPLSEAPDLSEASALPESPSFSSEDSVSFLS